MAVKADEQARPAARSAAHVVAARKKRSIAASITRVRATTTLTINQLRARIPTEHLS